MPNIDSANAKAVRLAEQASDVATPASGFWKAFFKSAGLHIINAAGTVSKLMTNPMTASGDITYGGASGVPTRLAAGSNGQVLKLASGVPSWAAESGMSNPMSAVGDIIIGGASGTPTRLAAGTNGHVLTLSGGSPAWAAASGGGGSGLYSAYALYVDSKASGTAGGSFTSGAWRTRTLNTEKADSGSIGSLASNQVTLSAGTYDFRAWSVGFGVNVHAIRLENVTDAATLGSSNLHHGGSAGGGGVVYLEGSFTVGASKAIELQARCSDTRATDGFGIAAGGAFTVAEEVFAGVVFLKRA